MLERLHGKTLSQIAKDYNCSIQTVVRSTDRARQRSLVSQNAQTIIGDKLIPLSIAVYEMHLQAGNLDAARDLLFGMSILEKTSNVKHESESGETLEAFRDAYFKARGQVVDITPPVPVVMPQGLLTPLEGIVDEGSQNPQYEPIDQPERRLPDLLDQSDEDPDE